MFFFISSIIHWIYKLKFLISMELRVDILGRRPGHIRSTYTRINLKPHLNNGHIRRL
jgi:hypothetical protein